VRILFVDDEPEQVAVAIDLVREVLGCDIEIASTVESAVALLHRTPVDLVVTDIFIPLGAKPGGALGPRTRRYKETVRHLGGLVLLDELDRVPNPPMVMAHTACTDFELIEVLGDRVETRIPKPAPADAMLRAVLEVLGLPTPH
jgi:CheY-like chemotaxis protein